MTYRYTKLWEKKETNTNKDFEAKNHRIARQSPGNVSVFRLINASKRRINENYLISLFLEENPDGNIF